MNIVDTVHFCFAYLMSLEGSTELMISADDSRAACRLMEQLLKMDQLVKNDELSL